MKITFLLLCAALCGGVAGAHSHELSTEDDTAADSLVQVVTKASDKQPESRPMFKPSFTLGGYITAKAELTDREGAATSSNFSMRYFRFYGSGYAWRDVFYRFQMEMSGAPGIDRGARLLDAYVEWRKFPELQVRLGQYHRPFGFDKPISPLSVGLGSFSQVASKLQSLNDRIGEHVSNGRDIGVQVQGDLFPVPGGRKLLHYQVGLFNGQGINHADIDHFKDLIGGLWICPVEGLSVGAFGWNGRFTDPTKPTLQLERKRYALGFMYVGRWEARGEYVHSHGSTTKGGANESDGWYAMAGTPIPGCQRLKVYGRWDCYRDDATTWQGLKTNWGLSANYRLGKNYLFQVNYTHTNDRAGADRNYNTIDVQVSAKF